MSPAPNPWFGTLTTELRSFSNFYITTEVIYHVLHISQSIFSGRPKPSSWTCFERPTTREDLLAGHPHLPLPPRGHHRRQLPQLTHADPPFFKHGEGGESLFKLKKDNIPQDVETQPIMTNGSCILPCPKHASDRSPRKRTRISSLPRPSHHITINTNTISLSRPDSDIRTDDITVGI
jgi:hypothetical protein